MTFKQSLYIPILALLLLWVMTAMTLPFVMDSMPWYGKLVSTLFCFASLSLIPLACSKLDNLEEWLSK